MLCCYVVDVRKVKGHVWGRPASGATLHPTLVITKAGGLQLSSIGSISYFLGGARSTRNGVEAQ